MIVLRNYLPDSSTKVITQGTHATTSQNIDIPNQLRGQTVSLSFESEVLAGNPPSQMLRVRDIVNKVWVFPRPTGNLPPSEGRVVWENINIPADSEYAFYFFNGDNTDQSLGNDFARWNIHLAIGEKASDVWVPAEEDLIPEQIATLPPYGEYKEIQSF